MVYKMTNIMILHIYIHIMINIMINFMRHTMINIMINLMIHLMTYIMNIIMINIMINVMTDIIMNLMTNITKSGLSQPRPPMTTRSHIFSIFTSCFHVKKKQYVYFLLYLSPFYPMFQQFVVTSDPKKCYGASRSLSKVRVLLLATSTLANIINN